MPAREPYFGAVVVQRFTLASAGLLAKLPFDLIYGECRAAPRWITAADGRYRWSITELTTLEKARSGHVARLAGP